MRRILVLIALATMALESQIVVAQDLQTTKPLSLPEAISVALRIHPDLGAAQSQREAAIQRLRQAEASLYPTISLGFDQSRSQISSGSANNVLTTEKSAGITVSWNLIDSGQRNAQIAQSRASAAGYTASLADTRQTVISNVVSDYYNVLKTQALVKVAIANVSRAQAALDSANAQLQVGVIAKKEVSRARADLGSAQVALVQAKGNASNAQANFKQSMGVVTTASFELEDVGAPSTSVSTTSSLDDLVKQALTKRQDVAQLQANIRSYQAAVTYARASNGLSLSLSGTANAIAWPDSRRNWNASLSVSLPLFNGGFSQAAIKEAQANLIASREQLRSKQGSVANEVEQALRAQEAAAAAIPSAEMAKKAAQDSYDATAGAFQAQVGSALDLVNAQAELTSAEIDFINARYGYYTSQAQLLRATGQIETLLSTLGGTK